MDPGALDMLMTLWLFSVAASLHRFCSKYLLGSADSRASSMVANTSDCLSAGCGAGAGSRQACQGPQAAPMGGRPLHVAECGRGKGEHLSDLPC